MSQTNFQIITFEVHNSGFYLISTDNTAPAFESDSQNLDLCFNATFVQSAEEPVGTWR